MEGEGIITIELAVGAAAFVLAARLLALVQATRAVPTAHQQLLEAFAAGSSQRLRLATRRLGLRTPYADLAREVIEADGSEHRSRSLSQATKLAAARMRRRTQQGQALDLVLLAAAGGLAAFSSQGLPAGPLFYVLAGCCVLLLAVTLGVRSRLQRVTISSLEQLRDAMRERPSLSGAPRQACPVCRSTAKLEAIRVELSGRVHDVAALVCTSCGALSTSLPSVANSVAPATGDGMASEPTSTASEPNGTSHPDKSQ